MKNKKSKQEFKLVIADSESNAILEFLGIFPNEREADEAGQLYMQTFEPADLSHLEYQIQELKHASN